MRTVGNYLSNSQEFLKKFGKQIADAAPGAFKKGLETAADKATEFSGDVYQNLKSFVFHINSSCAAFLNKIAILILLIHIKV